MAAVRSVPVAEEALPHPPLRLETSEPDLCELRAQLLALYRQCEDDLLCADELCADYERRILQADDFRRATEHRMSLVRAMLDLEFPGWCAR